MDAPQDVLSDKWPELKEHVRLHWGRLTADDLARLSGSTDDLASVLQKRYGYGKAQAIININQWLSDRDPLARQ